MCGIAGRLGAPRPGLPGLLAEALQRMAARGPDGEGRAEAQVGEQVLHLGARRLAQVDVRRAAQPVHRPSGALLAWNGEVYNHALVRRSLEERGARFTTQGDGEVLAALLEVEGLAGLARVEGSFAFAFLAGPEGPLWLGRDARGVRPLVVHATPHAVCFASTLEGLRPLQQGPWEPDLQALEDVLRDGVVAGERTAVQGVTRVPPGCVLEVDRRLQVREHRIPQRPRAGEGPSGAAGADAVLRALREAVEARLVLERPAALLLSGGVDSALVAALCASTQRLPCYTLAFPHHAAQDESSRAARTAQRLGLPHEVVACPADPTAWVLGAAQAFDEPFADASAVPAWALARAVGAQARVALTGTGGDEVFGGYRRYGALRWARAAGQLPGWLRRPLRRALRRPAPQAARLLGAADDARGTYRGLLRLQDEPALAALRGPRLREAACARPAPREVGSAPRTAAEAMADDLARYLPDDLLVKEDRALMAWGVEGRHPFLDCRVLQAAATVPLAPSSRARATKPLLRALAARLVDDDLASVRKQGFAFPVDALYRGPLRALAASVLGERRARERGLLEPQAVEALLAQHAAGTQAWGSVIHAAVMLELWCRRALDGRPETVA